MQLSTPPTSIVHPQSVPLAFSSVGVTAPEPVPFLGLRVSGNWKTSSVSSSSLEYCQQLSFLGIVCALTAASTQCSPRC